MTGPKADIGVVVTCYELGRTLGDALASVTGQTRPPVEIIVVDDGSRDPYTRSVLVLLESTVTVLRLEHGGPAAARNAGIERTTSELVVLLDGDDVLAPTYLERAGSLLDARADLAFVSCGLVAFGDASYQWTPPPFTIAESIARGACGHISTVFRRSLWDSVGGFDPSLPAYEDFDFWLTALEHGFIGEILDEPLLHYRVRRGSRYHLAISRDVYRSAKEAILAKHRASVETHGPEILALMLDFEREIKDHGVSLLRIQKDLDVRIRGHADERDGLLTLLRHRGVAPIEWGDLGSALDLEPAGEVGASVHSWYVKTFLEMCKHDRRGRVLEVRESADFPTPDEQYDTIVVLDALSSVPDPRRSLEACRNALAPDGVLLAVFPCLPLGRASDLRLFTEASARVLSCSVFGQGDVDVSVFGNLSAAVAAVAGLDADALSVEELSFVDDSYPVTIGVRAWGRSDSDQQHARRRSRSFEQGGRRLDGNVGVALVYHRVAEEASDPHGICTAPATFRNHMELLKADCRVLILDDLAEHAFAGTLPERAVAVTFDDGYLDNLDTASPILTELGIPATFFVCTERLDEEHEPWWEVAQHALLAERATPEKLTVRIAGHVHELPTGSPEERRRALLAFHALLIEADAAGRHAAVDQLLAWTPEAGTRRPARRVMTRIELRELAARPGHELGAHTVHHLMLTAQGAEVQRHELLHNKIDLEALLGRRVTAVAYPYGVADFATTAIASDVGFRTGWSVDGDVLIPQADPFRLPRLDLSQAGEASFGHALDQAFDVHAVSGINGRVPLASRVTGARRG